MGCDFRLRGRDVLSNRADVQFLEAQLTANVRRSGEYVNGILAFE
jgi:hypothetical protein